VFANVVDYITLLLNKLVENLFAKN
jgi:hypothetical protein